MRTIELSPVAIDDLAKLSASDRSLVAKAFALMTEAARTPFTGIGKPEPLKGDLRGYWSRRINAEHRLVYEVSEDRIRVVACRGHYER